MRGDLEVRRKKLSDEDTQLEAKIRTLQQEVSTLEQQAAALFEFRPPERPAKPAAAAKAPFVPPPSPPRLDRQVPKEDLPAVGTLRRVRDQRFLIIAAWDDVASGAAEAERLKARLVAPEDA